MQMQKKSLNKIALNNNILSQTVENKFTKNTRKQYKTQLTRFANTFDLNVDDLKVDDLNDEKISLYLSNLWNTVKENEQKIGIIYKTISAINEKLTLLHQPKITRLNEHLYPLSISCVKSITKESNTTAARENTDIITFQMQQLQTIRAQWKLDSARSIRDRFVFNLLVEGAMRSKDVLNIMCEDIVKVPSSSSISRHFKLLKVATKNDPNTTHKFSVTIACSCDVSFSSVPCTNQQCSFNVIDSYLSLRQVVVSKDANAPLRFFVNISRDNKSLTAQNMGFSFSFFFFLFVFFSFFCLFLIFFISLKK